MTDHTKPPEKQNEILQIADQASKSQQQQQSSRPREYTADTLPRFGDPKGM